MSPLHRNPFLVTWLREWPTLLMLAFCYAGLVLILLSTDTLGVALSTGLLALFLTLHSSLQHEVLHGHPFANQRVNDLLVFPAVGLWVPYERFRVTHLQHHNDPLLTDPHEDPESNYLSPGDWQALSGACRFVYRINNTLLGRMLLGPTLGLYRFYRDDVRAMLAGDRSIMAAYLLHALGVIPVLWFLANHSELSFWAYLSATYLALSILRIRTFLEHRAHDDCQARTVVIRDRFLLSWLFLNNNFHLVHHGYPRMPWYALPACYERHRAMYDARNQGYHYNSYWDVIRAFLLRPKDPVPHPLPHTIQQRVDE